MKKLGFAGLIVASLIVAVMLPAGMALAAPPHPSAGSFVNAGGVPGGSTLVLNINFKVTNDEDSGNVGYWALDNYNKRVQVWQAPDGSFYVVTGYAGRWQTFEGALSPGAGVAQGSDATGTFEGGYTATFTADGLVATPVYKIKGDIGSFDYGGTEADVLLGIYLNQTGVPNSFDWISAYFENADNFAYVNWGWTYHYRSQRWNNFDYGTTGDIVVP